jgi:hypothetical protein
MAVKINLSDTGKDKTSDGARICRELQDRHQTKRETTVPEPVPIADHRWCWAQVRLHIRAIGAPELPRRIKLDQIEHLHIPALKQRNQVAQDATAEVHIFHAAAEGALDWTSGPSPQRCCDPRPKKKFRERRERS